MKDGELGRVYANGEAICREGEKGEVMYVVQSGKVKITKHTSSGELTLATLGSGDIFGEMALFESFPRSATIRAKDDLECLALTEWDFQSELRANPGVAIQLLKAIARRLRDTNAELAAAREAARRGAQVWGVDPAPVMLRLARLLTVRGGGVTWLDGAAEALPLPDAAATVLWSLATVHHWPDLAGGLAEAFRGLARGGRLMAIERRRGPGATGAASVGWTDEQAQSFADSCVAAGFVDPHVATRHAGRKDYLIGTAGRSG